MSLQWSPSNAMPLLSTQESSVNDSVSVSVSSIDSTGVAGTWTWDRGDLPLQVQFTPNGNTITISTPNWDGLFEIEVHYQLNFVPATVYNWAAVPAGATIIDFRPPAVNRKVIPFQLTFTYEPAGEPVVVDTQTYEIEVFANYDVGKAQVVSRTVSAGGRAVARKGDSGTGHGCFPPRPSTSGSPDVFINGIPILRVSDSWSAHTCGNNTHAGTQSGGSDFVFVNGLAMARVGDSVSCGSAVAQGSDFVFCD